MGEIQILAVSHGSMAEGMVRAVSMVAGDLGHLDYLCLDEECSIEQFRERLSQKLEELKGAEQILVLADIQGGSPFTASIELLAQKGLTGKAFVTAGMNLPLMLTLVFQSQPVTEEALTAFIGEARESIRMFQDGGEEEEEL